MCAELLLYKKTTLYLIIYKTKSTHTGAKHCKSFTQLNIYDRVCAYAHMHMYLHIYVGMCLRYLISIKIRKFKRDFGVQ